MPSGQLVHMVSSPEAFHPNRCCPWFATSAQSHRTIRLHFCTSLKLGQSLLLEFTPYLDNVLDGSSLVLKHNCYVAYGLDIEQMTADLDLDIL